MGMEAGEFAIHGRYANDIVSPDIGKMSDGPPWIS